MARPRKKDIGDVNRRAELVVTAARLFQERGFHGTTMRDIAGAIRMQSGSPFYHFASKQELLFAGVQDGMIACLAALEAIDPAAHAPLEYFRSLARTHLGALLDTRSGVVPLVVHEWRYLEGDLLDQVLALRRRFEALWMAAFGRLKRAGLVRRADATACRFFLSALNGVLNWYDPEGKLGSQAMADELVDWAVGPSRRRARRRARRRSATATGRWRCQGTTPAWRPSSRG